MNDYTVWGMCYDPEWLAKNDDEPDMLIIGPTDLGTARRHAVRLRLMAPHAEWQVRNAQGLVVLDTEPIATPHEARVNRARRNLGGRGR